MATEASGQAPRQAHQGGVSHHDRDGDRRQCEEEARANHRHREGPHIRAGRGALLGNLKPQRERFDGLFEHIRGKRRTVEIRGSSSSYESSKGVLWCEDHPQEEAREHDAGTPDVAAESSPQLPRIHADLTPPVRRVARQHMMQIMSPKGIRPIRKIANPIPNWPDTRFKPHVLISAIERESLALEESSSSLSERLHGPELDTRTPSVKLESHESGDGRHTESEDRSP